RKILVELGPIERFPGVDQVGAEVGNKHEVGLALAHHLIGNRGTAALRVARVGLHSVSFVDDGLADNGKRNGNRLTTVAGEAILSRVTSLDVRSIEKRRSI